MCARQKWELWNNSVTYKCYLQFGFPYHLPDFPMVLYRLYLIDVLISHFYKKPSRFFAVLVSWLSADEEILGFSKDSSIWHVIWHCFVNVMEDANRQCSSSPSYASSPVVTGLLNEVHHIACLRRLLKSAFVPRINCRGRQMGSMNLQSTKGPC
jgi:hypothetical protein